MNLRSRIANFKAMMIDSTGAVSQEYAMTSLTATAIVGMLVKFVQTELGSALFTSVVTLIINLIPTLVRGL